MDANEENSESSTTECPTWYLPAENDTSKCVCGNTLNGKMDCLEGGQSESEYIGWSRALPTQMNNCVLVICQYVPTSVEVKGTILYLITMFPQNVSES